MDPQEIPTWQPGGSVPPPPGWKPPAAAGGAPQATLGLSAGAGTAAPPPPPPPKLPPGMVTPGNIDVNHRPVIWNDSGNPSTIYSYTVPVGKNQWALVPSIVDGRFLTPDGKIPADKAGDQALEDQALEHYKKSGQHLGIFQSQDAADAYARQTHAWMPNGGPEQVYMPNYVGPSNMPLTRPEYERSLEAARKASRPPLNQISANPRGEKLYRMKSPDGQEHAVPYSLVKDFQKLSAKDAYSFADPGEMHRYLAQFMQDPEEQQKLDELGNHDPAWDFMLNFARNALHALYKFGDLTSGGKVLNPQTMQFEDAPKGGENPLRQWSEQEPENIVGRAGVIGESYAEFGGLARYLKFFPELSGSQAGQAATKLMQLAEKHPLIAQSLNNALVGGTQSYIDTGGNTTSAALNAGLTFGTSALAGGAFGAAGRGVREAGATENIGGVEIPKVKPPVLPANQAKGVAAYGQVAGETIREPLERINRANQREVMATQPGGGPAVPTGRYGYSGDFPKIDTDAIIKRTGDYTRAQQELQGGLNDMTKRVENVTNEKKISTLTKELEELHGKAFPPGDWESTTETGSPEARQAFAEKQAELDAAIKGSKGVPQNLKDALRYGWKRYYALKSVAGNLDAALMGLPGAPGQGNVPGLYGKQLMGALNSAIRRHGRLAVEDAMGGGEMSNSFAGSERLKAMEAIAKATASVKGARNFGYAMKKIAEWVPASVGARVGWMMFGSTTGAIGGAVAGRIAAETASPALEAVRRAILTNPKIAQHVLFAIDSGANPKNYGPLISAMISEMVNEDKEEE